MSFGNYGRWSQSHFVASGLHGGGERTAKQFGVPFLGSVELDPKLREAGDQGEPLVLRNPEGATAKSFFRLAQELIDGVAELAAAGTADVIKIV